MKPKDIVTRVSDRTEMLRYGSLMALVVLSLGLLAATVSAQPITSPPVQDLPTRPPSSKPDPGPESPKPKDDSPPSKPGPAIPQPTTEVTPTDELSPDALLVPSIDLTFAELGYGTRTMTSSGTRRSYYLYLPRDLALRGRGHYLQLTLSHVPPVPDRLSTLSAKLNGTSLALIPLNQANAEPTSLRLDLAGSLFEPGSNELELELDTGEACGVRGARIELSILDVSLFHLEYDLVPYVPELALYPLPFYEASFDPQTTYFVLPDAPSAADLSGVASISAGLGKFSEGQVRLAAVRESQLTPEIRSQHHLIVVGRVGTNGLLEELDLPLELDEANVSEDQGVIAEIVSPWNPLRLILVVSGLSDEGMSKACLALNRQSPFLGMRGEVSIVQGVSDPPLAQSKPRDVDITLASLGYEDEVVCGTAPDTLSYRFYMPWGWKMIENPRLVLSFGHSEVVDPENSSLDVELNGVPVGSVLLDGRNVNEGLLEIDLPAWQIEPRRNTLNVSVEMNLAGEDKCVFFNDCHIWTVVRSSSYIHLPFAPLEVEASLALFPYPFSERPNLEDLLLVLPEEPATQDQDAMVRLAAMLGAAARGDYLTVQAVTAGDATESALEENNLIIFGRPTANSLIRGLNESLPQPFEDGTDLLRPQIGSVVFAPDPERDVGLIQEMVSPWNSNRTALVLTGTTDEGVSLACAALISRSDRLAGNVAVTEALTGTIYTYETRELAPAQEPQTVEKAGWDSGLMGRLAEWWW